MDVKIQEIPFWVRSVAFDRGAKEPMMGDAVTFSRVMPIPESFFTSLESHCSEASRNVLEVRR